MDHFTYNNGTLCAEDVPLDAIAAEVGTPFYCYSSATIERHFRVFTEALQPLPATLCYSVKANSNLAVIRTMAEMGAGADVVSGGELIRALKAGVPPERIVFSGVGKSKEEIAQAIDAGISQINVESEPEIAAINEVAAARGTKAPIALRINPDIDAGSHDKISTGRSEDKFGIEWTRAHEVFTAAAALPNVVPMGLAMHIGSQLANLQPFRDAFVRLRDVAAMLKADGLEIQTLDLGGGLGIPYDGSTLPTPAEYGAMVKDIFADLDYRLLFEPGRVIVGNAGILVTRVLYIKEGATRRFVILDAAMNDLMRPALYGAHHEMVAVADPGQSPREPADVVGPICETGDAFGNGVSLPPLKAGDLLAIRTAGAYGAVMASMYNSRALVPEVLVKDSNFAVVRERLGIEELLSHEKMPGWLPQTTR